MARTFPLHSSSSSLLLFLGTTKERGGGGRGGTLRKEGGREGGKPAPAAATPTHHVRDQAVNKKSWKPVTKRPQKFPLFVPEAQFPLQLVKIKSTSLFCLCTEFCPRASSDFNRWIFLRGGKGGEDWMPHRQDSYRFDRRRVRPSGALFLLLLPPLKRSQIRESLPKSGEREEEEEEEAAQTPRRRSRNHKAKEADCDKGRHTRTHADTHKNSVRTHMQRFFSSGLQAYQIVCDWNHFWFARNGLGKSSHTQKKIGNESEGA